jgi:hypothetical protein
MSGTINQPRIPNGYGMGIDYVFIGGLVGANKGTIAACFNKANVISQYDRNDPSSKMCSVGVVGYTEGYAVVKDCYNIGNVSVSGYAQQWSASRVGGIQGYRDGSSVTSISNCYNAGTLRSNRTGGYNGTDETVCGIFGEWNSETSYASNYITNVWSIAGVDFLWVGYRGKTDYWSDSGERCRNSSQ